MGARAHLKLPGPMVLATRQPYGAAAVRLWGTELSHSRAPAEPSRKALPRSAGGAQPLLVDTHRGRATGSTRGARFRGTATRPGERVDAGAETAVRTATDATQQRRSARRERSPVANRSRPGSSPPVRNLCQHANDPLTRRQREGQGHSGHGCRGRGSPPLFERERWQRGESQGRTFRPQ